MSAVTLNKQRAWFQQIREAFGCSAKRKTERSPLSEPEALKKEIEEIAKAIPKKFAGGFKKRSFERIDEARPGEMKKVADQIVAKELIPCFGKEDEKEEALAAICGDCAANNHLRMARAIAGRLQNPRFQTEAEGHLAYHFINSNDLDSAEPHAERIKDLSRRSEFLNVLSLKHLEKRNPLRAYAAAEKIPQDPKKSHALLRIFEYFRERSQVYLAYFSTCGMHPPLKAAKRADLFLDYLTKSRRRFKFDLEGLLNSIPDSHEKSRALWGYFENFLQSEDYDQAHLIAKRIPQPEIRSAALKKLFAHRSNRGEIRACRKIASELSPTAQTKACIALIDKVLKTHQFPRALEIAGQIKDPDEQLKQRKRIKKAQDRCLTTGELL